jgi:DNA polymerase
LAKLYIDLETRSSVDLPRAGQYAYGAHRHTEIILASWAIDDAPIATWFITRGEPIPDALKTALLDPAVTICAHNASFERVLMSLGPLREQMFLSADVVAAIKPLDRWDCTAARAAVMGLPRTLEGASRVLGLPAQKDMVGHKLMMKLCRPRAIGMDGRPIWAGTDAEITRLGEYCDHDVEPQRMIDNALPVMSPFEKHTWRLTEAMNDRGISIDIDLLGQMTMFVADAEADLNARIYEQTNRLVPKVSNHQAITKWLVAQGYPEVKESGIGKIVISEMLENEDLPELVREVLLMRREGGKTSTSKYRALLTRMNRDGRVRGAMVYCGAASTHRWSSRGAQLQNLSRGGTIPNILEALDDIKAGASIHDIKLSYGSPLVIASEIVRPTFIAGPGKWLARGDYSQIEDRVNNWYAGQTEQLGAFRKYDAKEGPDPYRVTAGQIYGVAPDSMDKDDPRRQVGKVTRLACGFAGGKGAILKMAQIYGVKMTEERAEEVKIIWREANPGIKQFWYDCENAALECMQGPVGGRAYIRPNLFFTRGSRVLLLRLPSGNTLTYWYPKVERHKMPWGKMKDVVIFWAEDGMTKQWSKVNSYSGLWVENICQSTSRDITAESLQRLEGAGYLPVLTVHDENVVEVSQALFPIATDAAKVVKDIMLVSPPWAAGIPINVDASAGLRYVKG